MKGESAVKGEKQKGSFFKSLIKGSLFALSISLISICIFAFLLRFFDISDDAIKPINQIIKIVSILVGVLFGLNKMKEMGLITGFLIGIVYTLLAFFVFSILNGGFCFDGSLINDLIFGGIAGAIAGIVSVNFKRK